MEKVLSLKDINCLLIHIRISETSKNKCQNVSNMV